MKNGKRLVFPSTSEVYGMCDDETFDEDIEERALPELIDRCVATCRGDRIFRPVVDGRVLDQVQVPVSLPTYDEVVGREVSAAAYNGFLLDRIRDDRLNVLAIHAEVEPPCSKA